VRGLHPTAETRHVTVRASLAEICHESRQRLVREVGATEIVTERGDEGAARIKELMMVIKKRRFDLLPREVSLETLVPADALVHEHKIAGVDLLGHHHPPGRSFKLVLNPSRSAAVSAPFPGSLHPLYGAADHRTAYIHTGHRL
jgi:hypothetical protein